MCGNSTCQWKKRYWRVRSADQVLGGGQVQRAGVRAEVLEDRLGDRGGAGFLGLGLDEGGAPGVGEELLDAAFG